MENSLARTDQLLGKPYPASGGIATYELDARRKLGKSPVWVADLPEGTVVGDSHVRWVSPADGLDHAGWRRMLGAPLLRNVRGGGYVQASDTPGPP